MMCSIYETPFKKASRNRPRLRTKMKLKIRRRDDHLIVFIEGSIHLHNAEKLYQYIEELPLPESKILIINMKGCTQVDSAGIGALMRILQLMKSKEARFHIARVPRGPRKILEEAGLSDYLPLLSDEEYHLSFEESEGSL